MSTFIIGKMQKAFSLIFIMFSSSVNFEIILMFGRKSSLLELNSKSIIWIRLKNCKVAKNVYQTLKSGNFPEIMKLLDSRFLSKVVIFVCLQTDIDRWVNTNFNFRDQNVSFLKCWAQF